MRDDGRWVEKKNSRRVLGQHVQLLTFRLDDQEYTLNIANVVQDVRMMTTTSFLIT